METDQSPLNVTEKPREKAAQALDSQVSWI